MLDDDDRKRWDEDGYLLLGSVVDDGDIAELVAEAERFRPAEGFGTQALLVAAQLCHRSEPIRRLCTSGPQIAVVQELMGPNVALTHTQLLEKLPAADGVTPGEIPLHQDNGYGRLDPMTDITVWIALTRAHEENGGLHIVPGSHRLGLLDHGEAALNRAMREAVAEVGEPVPVPLDAGEAVAFTGLTLHGSGPNVTDEPRVGFYVRYCEPHVKMLSHDGRPVLEDGHSWMVAGEAG